MRLVDEIAEKLYADSSNIRRASDYLRTRGIYQERMSFPCVATTNRVIPLQTQGLNPYALTDALIMPIVSVENRNVLAGFSVRHIGKSATRLRYITVKADPKEILCYYTRPFEEIRGQTLFVTESVIDAESITQSSGHPAVSFLSALFQPQILYWLSAVTDRIVFALDNDTAGNRCFSKYREVAGQLMEYNPSLNIRRMSFPCKDINECLTKFGAEFLKSQVNLFV